MTIREKALIWFNELDLSTQKSLLNLYFPDYINCPTGRVIEIIYKNEILTEEDND